MTIFQRLCVVFSVLVSGAAMILAAEVQSKPDPQAAELIEKVKTAYGQLKTIKVEGRLDADLDIAGKSQSESVQFTAEYQAPGMYRHAIKESIQVGSTGEKIYVHDLAQNVYLTHDAPNAEVSYRQLPGMIGQLLEMQDPSLLLAVSQDSLQDVLQDAENLQVAADTQVGGKSLPTLAYKASDGRQVTLAFDAKDHLLRRATYDLSDLMRSRGAEAVNKALVTIAYDAVQAGATFPEGYFAWSAPADAQELSGSGQGRDAAVLEGKPAPDFTLKTLDGKEVKLSSLKGRRVVLDFWATWCPPCVRALPEINELHHALKNKGVQIYAINVGEEQAQVQNFLRQQKLDLPVLLDGDENVMRQYGIEAIPTTILIRPDGTVHKVFTGMPPGGKDELKRQIDAAE